MHDSPTDKSWNEVSTAITATAVVVRQF